MNISLERYRNGVREAHAELMLHPDGMTITELSVATKIPRSLLQYILEDNPSFTLTDGLPPVIPLLPEYGRSTFPLTTRIALGLNAPMTHTINTDRTAAVSTEQYWQKIDSNTPRGVKILLLGIGGLAAIGQWDGKNKFWKGWVPLPKKPDWMNYE